MPHVVGSGPNSPDADAPDAPEPDVLADVTSGVTAVPPQAQDGHRASASAAHDVPDAAAAGASRCAPPASPPASDSTGPSAAPAERGPSRGAAPTPAQDSSAKTLAALPAPWHGVTVIVPVYGDPRSLAACLDALAQTSGRRPWRALLIDDASPDPAIAELLADRSGDGPFHLRRLTHNRGYIGAVTAALELATEGDVVLLNSDCVVPGGDWIDRLAAHAGDGVGTVTPLASDGQCFGFPLPFRSAPAFLGDRLARIDAAARHANAGRSVRMLTSVGFCTYVTRACLDATGGLRAEGLTAGYGEEVDFCLRASDAGLGHVAATDCFVTHLGSASFRAAKRALVRRNEAVLERRFPSYFARFAVQCAADPLRPARARIERALLETDARKGGVALIGRDAAALAESHAAWQALQAGEPVRVIEVDALAAPDTIARLSSPGLLWPQNISWRLPEDVPLLTADLAALGHPRLLVERDLAPLAAGWLGPQAFDLLPEQPGETSAAAGPSHLPAELRAACDADAYAGLYL
ncbi:glycosyltransferase [Rhodovulum sp. 12E13]|uniref:glycosyltransferase n=1 Tax=Rhodovulum sp. 12E13 TaxID=2203891 RepID=UPI0035196828